MVLTMERAHKIASSLKLLVMAVNSITKDDIKATIQDISGSEALGPMLDPTRWRDENLFSVTHDAKKVMRALLSFKEEVEGVGDFK